MLTDAQVDEIRSHFPILKTKTYLYNCSQGAMSDAAERGMRDFTNSWRTSVAPWEEWIEAYETLRVGLCPVHQRRAGRSRHRHQRLGRDQPDRQRLRFETRDQVVMSEYEFPTMGQIWLAQQPRGAQVRFLEGTNNNRSRWSGTSGRSMSRTAIVPLTHVSFINGVRSDVAAITAIDAR